MFTMFCKSVRNNAICPLLQEKMCLGLHPAVCPKSYTVRSSVEQDNSYTVCLSVEQDYINVSADSVALRLDCTM